MINRSQLVNALDETMPIDQNIELQVDIEKFQKSEQEQIQQQNDKYKMKTRRQSKGIVYFNRKKPHIEITIGSLEDWYVENQIKYKRRRLNQTVIEEDEEMKETYFTIDQQKSKLNKTMLHENWLEDFEKQQKKIQARNKKRKRTNSNRSRSRSPTPVKQESQPQQQQQQQQQLQKQIQQQQNKQQQAPSKSSSKNESMKEGSSSSSQIDSEEEDRRESEKIRQDIMAELIKKDEPLESQQLSIDLKYAQKYIEEGLQVLMTQGKIQKKDIGKKSYYLAVNQDIFKDQTKDILKKRVQEIIEIEIQEQHIDQELNKIEKQIKELKIKPTTQEVQNLIEKLKEDIKKEYKDIQEVKQKPDYMGDNMLKKQKKLQIKLIKLIEIFQKKKSGCIDMLDYFSQHLNESFEDIVIKCGIDSTDIELSEELANILGIQIQKEDDSQTDSKNSPNIYYEMQNDIDDEKEEENEINLDNKENANQEAKSLVQNKEN